MSAWTAAGVPGQDGRTVIVTGANTGLGFETAARWWPPEDGRATSSWPDLYVITGPHRLRLTIDGPVASATWNLEPRTGPSLLNQLREPLMTRPDVS